jgi:hypothetical protein
MEQKYISFLDQTIKNQIFKKFIDYELSKSGK